MARVGKTDHVKRYVVPLDVPLLQPVSNVRIYEVHCRVPEDLLTATHIFFFNEYPMIS